VKKSFEARSPQSGFTIVELLVAVAVTAAIVTFMVTIVVNVLNGWGRSTATLTAGNQSRIIMDQLVQDVETALLRRDANPMFVATIQPNQSGINANSGAFRGDAGMAAADWKATGAFTTDYSIKPGFTTLSSASTSDSLAINPARRELEEYRFGQAGVWLRFFTVPPDNSTTDLKDASAPRAVSYQIIRSRTGDPINPSPTSYQFFRSEARPYGDNVTTKADSTFTVGYNLFTTDIPGYNVGNGILNNTGNIRRPNQAQILGDGVIDFGLRIYARNASAALVEVFPVDRRVGPSAVRAVFVATTDTTLTFPPHGAAETSHGYPEEIEIFLRILTPEGIEIINNYEEDTSRFGASADKWWELAQQNSKVYTRKIKLRALAR
jgi:prepilin-type N-terminal cleavage/methylation domain-containing protein